MSHGPIKIESKGACIYCGASDVKLTDEHIVPLSLGGRHIIREASCQACCDITKRFEQDVARGLWGDARISYDAPSRRKSERKTHIVLSDPEDATKKVKVPYHDYPAPMVFYRMGRAGLLEGMPDSLDMSGAWRLEAISDHTKSLEFERKYGIKLTAKFKHVSHSFGRLLAKIGYGQILCTLEPSDFRPICVPYILGHKRNLSYVVGGKLTSTPPDPDMGYVLRTAGFGTADRMLLIAEIRLYANNETPMYHVVVGDVFGAGKVAMALAKIGKMDFIPLPSTFVPGRELDHWMPTCWPLPFWSTQA